MDYKELVARLRATEWTNVGFTDGQSLEWDAADAITELLARAENAEKKLAECEPKHGHWIYHPHPTLWFGPGNPPESICSICGGLDHDTSDFCTYCRAKMDEQ